MVQALMFVYKRHYQDHHMQMSPVLSPGSFDLDSTYCRPFTTVFRCHWHLLISLLITGFFWDRANSFPLPANVLLESTKAGPSYSRSTFWGIQIANAYTSFFCLIYMGNPCMLGFVPQEIWEKGKMLLCHFAISWHFFLRWDKDGARDSGP